MTTQLHNSNRDFSILLGARPQNLHQVELFMTFHGQGVVDGIRGTVKRTVWRNIQSKKIITTAQEYAALAKQLCTNIEIDFI